MKKCPYGEASSKPDTGKDVDLPFSDLAQSVRDDVETIKGSPFIGKDIPVRGCIYDVSRDAWGKSAKGPSPPDVPLRWGSGRRSAPY
jgi:hypothetical protein